MEEEDEWEMISRNVSEASSFFEVALSEDETKSICSESFQEREPSLSEDVDANTNENRLIVVRTMTTQDLFNGKTEICLATNANKMYSEWLHNRSILSPTTMFGCSKHKKIFTGSTHNKNDKRKNEKSKNKLDDEHKFKSQQLLQNFFKYPKNYEWNYNTPCIEFEKETLARQRI